MQHTSIIDPYIQSNNDEIESPKISIINAMMFENQNISTFNDIEMNNTDVTCTHQTKMKLI